MSQVIFQLEPLSCPSCIKGIERTLLKQEGVDSVKVLFNSGKVKVNFEEKVIQEEAMRKVLKQLGYPVLHSTVA